MINTEKKYYIVDSLGTYYKQNKKNKLVATNDRTEADIFSIQEANRIIGGSGDCWKYTTIEVDVEESNFEAVHEVHIEDNPEVRKVSDGMDNNWLDCVTRLCYMSSHIQTYQTELNSRLSTVDRQIQDIMHFIEFCNPNDDMLLKVARELQEIRIERRKIKNEIEQIDLVKSSFLDKDFDAKIHQTLESMKKMQNRKYSPREMPELFEAMSFVS